MTRRASLLIGSMVLASILPEAAWAARQRYWHRPDCDRGIAILSPLVSPDPCDSVVGGAYRWTPYYQGYSIDRRCPPAMFGRFNSYRLSAPPGANVRMGSRTALYGRGDFGSFSGASRDENYLQHLGGFGPGVSGNSQPTPGHGDIIDRIQSGN